ncbi:uncharacterized protein LOC124926607 isoform X2 [Impatiens glandulifera]|uniref:uncharacterized protein LOC124926607 isoform X2 n=1 Tax=Impatiens glandulifera TaxID=253017 RepID=UPI001FB09B94|nr:uncharacterized protein LOC124926607 isoform X2 [Impatiens glandulifera]
MAIHCWLPPAMAKSPSSSPPLSVTSIASRAREYKMRVPYELSQEQSRLFHKLPSGLSMEVISQKGHNNNKAQKSKPPPLVFLHGSYHAAWCWAEHWLPYFSQKGHDCYALSFLGQGESDSPAAEVSGSLQTHAADVADFIREEITVPPLLLGHSFGALIVQYYISKIRSRIADMENIHPDLAGAVLICSVPPSGNSGLVRRYIFTKPIAAFKIRWAHVGNWASPWLRRLAHYQAKTLMSLDISWDWVVTLMGRDILPHLSRGRPRFDLGMILFNLFLETFPTRSLVSVHKSLEHKLHRLAFWNIMEVHLVARCLHPIKMGRDILPHLSRGRPRHDPRPVHGDLLSGVP